MDSGNVSAAARWLRLDARRHARSIETLDGGVVLLNWNDLPSAIRHEEASALCVEFDWPQPADLMPIGPLARQFPRLPIVVLSSGHSEALALQALRVRAWDFVFKPIAVPALQARIDALVAQAAAQPDVGMTRTFGGAAAAQRTAAAVAYVAREFRGTVSADTAAHLCHLSLSQFSRVFKREHGQTFGQFVIAHRIGHACGLLSRAEASVKQAALCAGFSDLAYFSRSFRRAVGVSPRDFAARS